MQLKEIREKINALDIEIKQRLEQRLMQSREVAQSKMLSGDAVYQPDREKEMEQMYDATDDSWYLLQQKKIIEISRKYQYSVIIDRQAEDAGFLRQMSEGNRKVLLEGGTLKLSIVTDEGTKRTLNRKGVLSILSSTSLCITHLKTDMETGKMNAWLQVDNTDMAKREAYLVGYMLYKEAILE